MAAAATAAAAVDAKATKAKPDPSPSAVTISSLTREHSELVSHCFVNTFLRENQTIAIGDSSAELLKFARGYFPTAADTKLSTVATTKPAANSSAAAAAAGTSANAYAVVGFGSAWDVSTFIEKTHREMIDTETEEYTSRAIDSFVLYCLQHFILHERQTAAHAAAAVQPPASASIAACVNVAPREYVFVDLLGVESYAGGRGIATDLVSAIEARAVDAGFKRVVVIASSVGSQKLFPRAGYEPVLSYRYGDVTYVPGKTGAGMATNATASTVRRPFASITDVDSVLILRKLLPAALATASASTSAAAPAAKK